MRITKLKGAYEIIKFKKPKNFLLNKTRYKIIRANKTNPKPEPTLIMEHKISNGIIHTLISNGIQSAEQLKC